MKVRRCNIKVLFTSICIFFASFVLLLLLLLLLFCFEHQRHFSNIFQRSSHQSVGMSSLCQFGSLWMGMFNLLTKNSAVLWVGRPGYESWMGHYVVALSKSLHSLCFVFSDKTLSRRSRLLQGLGQETLISHARDYCVMDVLPWVGLGGFVTCKAHLNIFISIFAPNKYLLKKIK